MTSANKAKGSAWELAVTRFLQEKFGRRAHRPHAEGFLDVGDVHMSPFAFQCKNVGKIELASFVEDAELQAHRAGEPFGLAVVKRRGKGAGAGYVVCSLDTFRRIAERLADAETYSAR